MGLTGLSRRERQIMDVLYRKGRATAAEILEELPEPPSNSAVRAMLRTLEEARAPSSRRFALRLHACRAARKGAPLGRGALSRNLLRRLNRASGRHAALIEEARKEGR